MAKFKAGDKVVHASGYGPTMVVQNAFDAMSGLHGTVAACDCEYWSVKEEKFIRERFPETSLEFAPEDDGDF